MPPKTVGSPAICRNGAISAACAVGTAVAGISSRRTRAEQEQNDSRCYLEMYLMDKIAKKSYLNYRSTPSSAYQHQAKRYGRENNEKPGAAVVPSGTRPKGVPSRLRLLAIDIPQFKREAFQHGVCKIPSEIFDTDMPAFVDNVAPPKPMNKALVNNAWAGTRASKKPIFQKSLAKQLYYCYDPGSSRREGRNDALATSEKEQPKQSPAIGVEILEASVMDLNPNNIRRTYTSTRVNWKKKAYRYDPGKYTENAGSAEEDGSGVADVDEAEVEEENLEKKNIGNQSRSIELEDSCDSDNGDFLDNLDYARTSPRNQYAWLEEIRLRINGIVPFGAPVQQAPFLSRWLYGRIYRESVPTSPYRGGWLSWLWWPVLWTGSNAVGSRHYRALWDGVDGEGENVLYGSESACDGRIFRAVLPWASPSKTLNRASNKPHAVICDGASMQRVPGSLRYLTKMCHDAGIPLYILNDPRSWGSQTHSTLSDALVDMRKAVSDNIIRNSLDLREGSAFERGRLAGQLEKEMAWQAYDAARKTRDSLVDARNRLRKDKEDWSELSREEITRKLVERKAIKLQNEGGEDDKEDVPQSIKCSAGLIGLCRHCIETKDDNSPTADRSV